MKGKFDAYVLWPLAKKFQNWIVDQSTARDFTVANMLTKSEKKNFGSKTDVEIGCHTVIVKSRAVDRSTIQFWNFLAKGHST